MVSVTFSLCGMCSDILELYSKVISSSPEGNHSVPLKSGALDRPLETSGRGFRKTTPGRFFPVMEKIQVKTEGT